MEAQLKKRSIFKAPRPAAPRDALTTRAGAGAADPFSSSDDDSQKDEEAVLERLARPPPSDDEDSECKDTSRAGSHLKIRALSPAYAA